MSRLTIRGSSDDIVCVEGDLTEEFYPGGDETHYLAFSDGTMLSVRYNDDGMWRINRLAVGSADYEKIEATDPDGDYSDRVKLDGDIRWAVFGGRMERIKGGVTL